MLNSLDIALLCDSRSVDAAGNAITPDKSVFGRIYTITNRINGKQYVGQTRDKLPDRRWNNHVMLAHHPEKPGADTYLYRAMRLHGLENFEYRVIELCYSEDELNEREVYWIEELNALAPNGYNFKTGGYRPSLCETGRLRFSIAQSKHRYTLIPPNGEAFSLLKGIGLWGRKNNLSDGTLISLAKYMAQKPHYVRRHRGWACCYAEDYEELFVKKVLPEDNSYSRSADRIKNRYVVRTPDGVDILPLDGLAAFCKRYNLSAPRMYTLAEEWRTGKGKRHTYKGWMCCYHDDYKKLSDAGDFILKHKPKLLSDAGKYIVKLPDGALVVPVISFKKWCEHEGISDFSLRETASNGGPQRLSRKGYGCWLHDDYMEMVAARV